MPAFIGIDYHKTYSVYNVLDVQGESWRSVSTSRSVFAELARRLTISLNGEW